MDEGTDKLLVLPYIEPQKQLHPTLWNEIKMVTTTMSIVRVAVGERNALLWSWVLVVGGDQETTKTHRLIPGEQVAKETRKARQRTFVASVKPTDRKMFRDRSVARTAFCQKR